MVLQMLSFISPVISHIPDGGIRESVYGVAENAVRGMKF